MINMNSDILRTSTFNKTKFNFRSPTVDRASIERFNDTQASWSKGHMYRTSYTDMSDKVSIFTNYF